MPIHNYMATGEV